MGVYALNSIDSLSSLVRYAQESDEPIIVVDGNDECLIAMRPSVFEHILYDNDLLRDAREDWSAFSM